jgi:hypothetical protein
MFLQINDTMTVEEVQDRFTECFPSLKIEFYSKAHKRYESTDKRYAYSGKEKIGNIRKNHTNGALEIKSWHTVMKVEKELEDLYGLHGQIFRGSPEGIWVQTSDSDELTLQEQNDLAMRLHIRQ